MGPLETAYISIVANTAGLGAQIGAEVDKAVSEATGKAEASMDRLVASVDASNDKIAASFQKGMIRSTEEATAATKKLGDEVGATATKTKLATDKAAEGGTHVKSAFAGIAGATSGLPIIGPMFEKIAMQVENSSSKLGKFGAGLMGVGKIATLGAVAGIVAVGVESVKSASKFQASMEMIHTQAGVSQQGVDALQGSVLGLAGKVGYAPEQLSESLYHLASNGLRGKDSMKALQIAAEGAKTGQSDLVDTTNALGAVIAAKMVPGAHNYAAAMGEVNAAVGSGDMHMEDFAKAMSTGVLASVHTMGVNLTDVSAALATFGDNNIRGAKAGTDLRMAVQALAAPTKTGEGLLSDMGYTTGNLTKQLQKGGLKGAIDSLSERMKAAGYTSKTMGDFLTTTFGKRAGVGLAVLESQVDRFNGKFALIHKSTGSFQADWEATQKTFKQQTAEMVAGLQALGDRFGMFLIPKIQELGKAVADVVVWFKAHMAVTKALALAIGGPLLAASALWILTMTAGAILSIVGVIAGVARGFGALKDVILGLDVAEDANPMGALVIILAAVGVAVYELYKHWSTVWAEIQKITAPIVAWFKPIWNAVLGPAKAIFAFFHDHWRLLAPILLGPFAPLGEVATHFSTIERVAKSVFASISKAVQPAVTFINTQIASLTAWWNSHFSEMATVVRVAWRIIQDISSVAMTATAAVIRFGWKIIDTVFSVGWGAVTLVFRAAWGVIGPLVTLGMSLIRTSIVEAMAVIVQVFRVAWAAVKLVLKDAWDAFKLIVAVTITVLETTIGVFLDLITGHWSKAWTDIKTGVHQILNELSTFIHGILQNMLGFAGTLLSALGAVWRAEWTSIKADASAIWHAISAEFSGLGQTLRSVWNAIAGFFTSVWRTFSGQASTIWHGIVNGIEGAWKGLTQSATNVWNDVKGVFNTGTADVRNAIDKLFISPMDRILSVFHIKNIPLLATGGTVGSGFMTNGPTAIVGEGRPAYPEFVLPTDPMYRSNTMNLLGKMLPMIGLATGGTVPTGRGGALGSGGAPSGYASTTKGGFDPVHIALSGLRDLASMAVTPAINAVGSAVEGILSKIQPSFFGQFAAGAIGSAVSGIDKWVSGKQAAAAKGGGPGGPIPAGAHLAMIRQALGMAGVADSAAFEKAVNIIVTYESGWNPTAINLQDSNAAAGHPSQGLMQCVTLDTKILTRRGWLTHAEVRVGDETLGYNPVTGHSEWTPVTKVVHYDDAPVWRIGNRTWHADVTPNHRWWSDRVDDKGGRHGQFVRTEDLRSRDRIRLAAPATTDGIVGLSVEDAAVIGWLQGNGHVRRGREGGWDGWIYQSKPDMVVKIRALLARIPHSENVRNRGGNTMQAHIFGLRRSYVTDLWKRSGMSDPKTDVEAFVLGLSPEQRAAWLGAIIDAEGHTMPGKRVGYRSFTRIAQINGPMQDAIRLAVFLEGYRPTYSANSAERNGYQPAGTVGMATPHVAPGSFLPHRELESQTVWCVKTELETWTAMLDGQVFITGNTIPGTFEAYRIASLPDDITNPMANMVAGIRYAMARYGTLITAGVASVENGGKYIGYRSGGVLGLPSFANGGIMPGSVGSPGLAMMHGGELTVSLPQLAALRNGQSITTPAGTLAPGGGGTYVYAPVNQLSGIDPDSMLAQVQAFHERGFAEFVSVFEQAQRAHS